MVPLGACYSSETDGLTEITGSESRKNLEHFYWFRNIADAHSQYF